MQTCRNKPTFSALNTSPQLRVVRLVNFPWQSFMQKVRYSLCWNGEGRGRAWIATRTGRGGQMLSGDCAMAMAAKSQSAGRVGV